MRFGAILLCAGLLAAQTQPAAQDQCGVEGTVLNSATGQPVPRAVVTMQQMGGFQRTPRPAQAPAAASSNAEGKFVFTGLAPGSYRIMAQRDNFQYIPPRNYEPVTLGAGDRKTGVAVQLTPLGAIAGHVQNEEGDALPNVSVNVMAYQYTQDGRQLLPRNGAQTNDLGDYRIFGIPAGKYVLRAATYMGRQTPGVDEVYVPAYYPGATDDSGASAVGLAAGQDVRGVDFTLRRVHGVTVRGHAAKPAGAQMVNVSLSSNGAVGGINNGSNDAEGNFELRGVPPGAYILTARSMAGDKAYTAERAVQVGSSDIEGIEFTLAPPVDVSGVVRFEGTAPVKLSQVLIMLQATRQAGQAKVNDDGTFSIGRLAPAVYTARVNNVGQFFIKAVRCGTADVTESAIDLTGGAGCDLTITLSGNVAQIEGQVQDGDEKPAPNAFVTLVSAGSRSSDLFRQAITDSAGHFKMNGIAPGGYRLYAWEEVDTNALQWDPEFIKPFEGKGQDVQVSEGDKGTVSLKVIGKAAER